MKIPFLPLNLIWHHSPSPEHGGFWYRWALARTTGPRAAYWQLGLGYDDECPVSPIPRAMRETRSAWRSVHFGVLGVWLSYAYKCALRTSVTFPRDCFRADWAFDKSTPEDLRYGAWSFENERMILPEDSASECIEWIDAHPESQLTYTQELT